MKQRREETRLASLQLVIAQSAGVKINGRAARLTDFLPRYAKQKTSGVDELMKEAEAALAAQKKKPNGTE